MLMSWRRVSLLLPGFLLACSFGSSSASSSNSSSTGGCGGGGADWGSSVKDAPRDSSDRGKAPGDPAPTGQRWKPVETESCGRMGISWVLVDEVCGDGEGNDDPDSLHAPMFRDGALVGDHLFAVDATHLWTFDLAKPSALARASLLTGLGTPLAVDRRQSELVLAAGASGLVMVDATNPALPVRSRSIALAGSAFDVQVSGDKAIVAMGAAGIAEVDLAAASPTIARSWPVAGFSAGVATRGGYAYVAACSTFEIVDLANGKVVSKAWVPNAIVNDRLVAPAKKVTLVGDVAFVAAGRYGAVAIDVSDPLKPSVLGNCTIGNTPSFYASGVRAGGDTLYVAGGEWGILPVDATNPMAACTKLMAQAPPQDDPDISCSSKPPWEVVPWEKIWAPPPPGKDPVQTLPAGDRVYAFGDARRIGVRAVDVRSTLEPKLPIVERFDEPRTLLGVAAAPGRVVAVGPRGGVFTIEPSGALTRTTTAGDAALQASTAVTLLADGRWAALGAAGIAVEGRGTPIPLPNASALAAFTGAKLAVTSPAGVHVIDVDTGTRDDRALLHGAALPLTVAADATRIYYAAPEWTAGAQLEGANSTSMTAHTVFDAEDIMDASLWRMRLPRRLLATSERGLIEVAGVGPAVGLVVHSKASTNKVSLPAMTYVGAATDGAHAYLVAIDRSLYKSYLVSVDIAGAKPSVLSIEAFSGAASGVAVSGGRVFVADADGALRTYSIGASGAAAFAASTEVVQ